MTELDTLFGIIEKAVVPMFKYAVPRIGKVVDRDDDTGRVLVQVPSLGWDTNDKGAWCFPTENKALKVPEINDYVLVEWVDQNPDIPIYRGIPGDIKDQIPENYDGDPKNNILFEGSADDIIKFKEGILRIIMSGNIFLGKEKDSDPDKGAARLDDSTISTSSEDSAFWAWLSGFVSVFTAWVPSPGDGGTVLKTALTSYIAASPTPTEMKGKIDSASETVKVGD